MNTHRLSTAALLVALSLPCLASHVKGQETPPAAPTPAEPAEAPSPPMTSAQMRAAIEEASLRLARAERALSDVVLARNTSAGASNLSESLESGKRDLRESIEALFDIPEVPAAFVLGGAANPVARPSTVRDAVSQIMSVVDTTGIRPGVAIELAPVDMMRQGTPMPDGDVGVGSQILESLRFSLATSTDPDDDDGSLLALGMRVSLLDQRNYRFNTHVRNVVRRSIGDALANRPVCPPPDLLEEEAPATCDAQTQYDEGLIETQSADIDAALEELEQGARIELAAALILDGDALLTSASAIERRDVRVWLTADRGFDGGSLGAALDLTVTGRSTATSTSLDNSIALRVGAFMELEPSWGGVAFHLLYTHEETDGERDPNVKYAIVARLRATTGTTARLGLVGESHWRGGRETRAELIAGVEFGTPMVPATLQ